MSDDEPLVRARPWLRVCTGQRPFPPCTWRTKRGIDHRAQSAGPGAATPVLVVPSQQHPAAGQLPGWCLPLAPVKASAASCRGHHRPLTRLKSRSQLRSHGRHSRLRRTRPQARLVGASRTRGSSAPFQVQGAPERRAQCRPGPPDPLPRKPRKTPEDGDRISWLWAALARRKQCRQQLLQRARALATAHRGSPNLENRTERRATHTEPEKTQPQSCTALCPHTSC